MELEQFGEVWVFDFDEVFPNGVHEAITFAHNLKGQVNISMPTVINGRSWSEMLALNEESVEEVVDYFAEQNIKPEFNDRSSPSWPSRWLVQSSKLH